MKILGLDTETANFNAKGAKWVPGEGSIDAFTHVVQIGWQIYDRHGELLKEVEHIIYPQDANGDLFEIAPRAEKIHGLSTARCMEFGKPAKGVFAELMADLEDVDVVVTHNGISFDIPLVIAECIRFDLAEHDFENAASILLPPEKMVDTMKHHAVKGWIDARAKNGNRKAPSMDEMHHKCFGRGFAGSHTALGDVKAMMDCFWYMFKEGILSNPLVPLVK